MTTLHLKKLAIALAILAVLVAPAVAAPGPTPISVATPTLTPIAIFTPTPIECCNYHLDLSTGQGNGPQDPLWKVNSGNPTYITSPFPGWLTAPFSPARWIQQPNSPTPQIVPPGVYRYTADFVVPDCPVRVTVQLNGTFAADNSALVFLQPGNHQIPITTCLTFCFTSPQAPVSLSVPSVLLVPGSHTLEIRVKNDSSVSGLIVNAQLEVTCP